MDGIRAALHKMLGPDAGIGVTDPRTAAELWPQETAAITRAIPKRRAEFAAGRSAARMAMAELGLAPCTIPQGPDRAPTWPAELSGSIAHCDDFCIAAVAFKTHYKTLGIDIEPATPLATDLTDIICTKAERDWLASQPDASLAAKMIFSAKEAVYKAQYPLTRQIIGFDAVTLTISNGSFTIAANPALPNMKGAILTQDGLILSVAYA
jgi:4'-phosphopantetheinyl transferase EntD